MSRTSNEAAAKGPLCPFRRFPVGNTKASYNSYKLRKIHDMKGREAPIEIHVSPDEGQLDRH